MFELDVKNAISRLNMKNFSLLGSVSKEIIKKKQIGKCRNMSGVVDRASFALHLKVIGQEFCYGCFVIVISKQNDFPRFFSLNNLLVKVCLLLPIENFEFRLY